MKKSPWILSILLLMSLFSCEKPREETLTLPSISLLEKKSSWGVVITNYLRLRKEPDKDAGLIRSIPKGQIAEILSNTSKLETIEEQSSYWYRVNFDGLKGWVFGSYLEIFNSQEKAVSFSNQLK
ncbi:MAG: SH3 domain-containing protein [Spirochaetales bacterium]|nr:SH3 domain-containing protein [Spirochaetales bacterium]